MRNIWHFSHTSVWALIGAAGSVHAQVEGTGTWLWEVTTQNGDAIVEPGETATITLSVDMDPDVNWPDGPVLAFGGAEFDTLGMTNADNGHIAGWEFFNDLALTFGDQTTTGGVSLFGSIATQVSFFHFVTDDPIDVMAFEWTPDKLGQYDVTYATFTAEFFVWQGDANGKPDVFAVYWPIVEADIAFSVIPAPGILGIPGVTAAFLFTRRRTRQHHI